MVLDFASFFIFQNSGNSNGQNNGILSVHTMYFFALIKSWNENVKNLFRKETLIVTKPYAFI